MCSRVLNTSFIPCNHHAQGGNRTHTALQPLIAAQLKAYRPVAENCILDELNKKRKKKREEKIG